MFGGATGADNTPVLFYSRRIGLSGTQTVPIVGGGRLVGRVGKFSVGVLNIESDEVPASGTPSTDFSVVRVKRDVFRRSSIGAICHGAIGDVDRARAATTRTAPTARSC